MSANAWWWTCMVSWTLVVVLVIRWLWLAVDRAEQKLEIEDVYRRQLEEVEAGYEEWREELDAKYGKLDTDKLMVAVGQEVAKPKLVTDADHIPFALDEENHPHPRDAA